MSAYKITLWIEDEFAVVPFVGMEYADAIERQLGVTVRDYDCELLGDDPAPTEEKPA